MLRNHPALARLFSPSHRPPRAPGASAPRHKLHVVLAVVAGLVLGALGMWVIPLLGQDREAPPELPLPARITGSRKTGLPKLRGDVQTVMRAFELEDLEGHTVLHVDKLSAFVDLDAMRRGVVRMPRGHASHIALLLRRGSSGRVSLSEAVRGSTDEPKREKSTTRLDVGPLVVEDVDMTVDMGDKPVLIHVSHAKVRIQRTPDDLAPRIYLSEIHGNLEKPDPLEQPIAIRGAEGVVHLEGGPLVDMRARVCIGNSEMRLRIEMPQRKTQVQMTVDAEGPLANAALMGLGIASKSKSEKLAVDTGSVRVTEPFDCSRDAGKALRDRMEQRERDGESKSAPETKPTRETKRPAETKHASDSP
jgi:hypothetical protein